MRPLFALALAASTVACDPTTGSEVPFHMVIANARVDDAPAGRFTTASGWEVTLTEAAIAVGPVYAFENPPPVASRSLWELLVPRALAGPGHQHFAGGAVLGEFVDQVLFDALGPPLDLGELIANAATARSFSVVLNPPRESLVREANPTRSHHAWAAGTATKDGAAVAFEGGLDIEKAGTLRSVDGLPLEAPFAAGGTLTVRVHLESWFDEANFASLTEDAPGGRKAITQNSQVGAAWFIGARNRTAFSAAWSNQ